jgi:hypothetical protein
VRRRADDIRAFFDRLGTSNGPTEAINGRLEHLGGSASGSETSPTTSPGPYSSPAASDPSSTLNGDAGSIPVTGSLCIKPDHAMYSRNIDVRDSSVSSRHRLHGK